MAEWKDAPKFLIKRLKASISKKDRELAIESALKISSAVYLKNGKLLKRNE